MKSKAILKEYFTGGQDETITVEYINDETYKFDFPEGTIWVTFDDSYAVASISIQGFNKEYEEFIDPRKSYNIYDLFCGYFQFIEFFKSFGHFPDSPMNDISPEIKGHCMANLREVIECCSESYEENTEIWKQIGNGSIPSIDPIYLFDFIRSKDMELADGVYFVNSYYQSDMDYSEVWPLN